MNTVESPPNHKAAVLPGGGEAATCATRVAPILVSEKSEDLVAIPEEDTVGEVNSTETVFDPPAAAEGPQMCTRRTRILSHRQLEVVVEVEMHNIRRSSVGLIWMSDPALDARNRKRCVPLIVDLNWGGWSFAQFGRGIPRDLRELDIRSREEGVEE